MPLQTVTGKAHAMPHSITEHNLNTNKYDSTTNYHNVINFAPLYDVHNTASIEKGRGMGWLTRLL